MIKFSFITLLAGLFGTSAAFCSSFYFQSLSEGSIVVQFYQDKHLGKRVPEQFIIFHLNQGQYDKTKTIDQISCGQSCWRSSTPRTAGVNAHINSDQVLNILSLEDSRASETSSYLMSNPKVRNRNSSNFDPDANLSYKISIAKICPDGRRKLLEIYDVDGHMIGTKNGKLSLFVQETYRLPYNIDSVADQEHFKKLIKEVVATTKATLRVSFPGRNERAFRLNAN
jgi:hypothetical protein